MNIGITCYPTHGGSGVVATELGKELARRGHQTHFISYSAPLRLAGIPENIYFHEVPVTDYPLLKQYPYTLAMASKMAEVALDYQLDVLHVHYAIPFTAAALLARGMVPELDLKIVTTLHGTDTNLVGANSSFRMVTRYSIEQSDAVTAVSTHLRDETARTFHTNRRIDVISNFIDPNHYRCVPTPMDADARDPKTLIHISNFRAVKRVADVIRIFARVVEHVDAVLLLVGDGPELGSATALARELGVYDHLRLVGVVDEVSPHLGKADLLLLPSETESFGLAALEAMASCVPVVASRIGGIPEVVDDGVSGVLAPVGDVEAMARGAIELLTNPARHLAFSRAARERAATVFSADRIIPQFEDLYRALLANRGLAAGSSG